MPYLVAFGGFGPWEIALIVLIILIVFGVGKLPQVGGAVGRAIREFRTSVRDETQGSTAQSRQLPEASPKREAEEAKTTVTSEGEEPPRS